MADRALQDYARTLNTVQDFMVAEMAANRNPLADLDLYRIRWGLIPEEAKKIFEAVRRYVTKETLEKVRQRELDKRMAPYRAMRRANLLRKYPFMRGLP